MRSTINCTQGREQGQGTEAFTGSVKAAGSGSLTWRISFKSGFDCKKFSISQFAGRGVVISGTGQLGKLRGSLNFTETSYSGQFH